MAFAMRERRPATMAIERIPMPAPTLASPTAAAMGPGGSARKSVTMGTRTMVTRAWTTVRKPVVVMALSSARLSSVTMGTTTTRTAA
tara:strand:+ start:325 stop:585 length:261 start_codon:yes stop_codon:yes gene_type:complete